MKALSEQIGLEKEAIWGHVAAAGASMLPKISTWGRNAWNWMRGAGNVAKSGIGPSLPATGNVLSRAGKATMSGIKKAPGATWGAAKDIAKNRKMDAFMFGGLGTALPLGIHYGIQMPAMQEQEKKLQELQNNNIALARYMQSESNNFKNQLQNQQATAQQRGIGGVAGAGMGATLGNLLSRGLGFNKDIGTALGTAAGAYLGSQYGPGAGKYISDQWNKWRG